MKLLTGFAIINDRNGKRVTYTYDTVDTRGNLIDNNVKESFIVLDESTQDIIETLEGVIKSRMNEQD